MNAKIPAAGNDSREEIAKNFEILKESTQTPYLLVATLTPTPMVEVTTQDFR